MVEQNASSDLDALTKGDLVDQLIEEFGVHKRDANDLVDLFFEEIRSGLERGHFVKLSGFGNFELKDKASRPGRNPKTGERVLVTARRVVTFKPGQKLKYMIQRK